MVYVATLVYCFNSYQYYDVAGKLVARLKEIFHISESTKFRVWHHYTVNIGDLLTSSRMTLKDAGLTSEQVKLVP